MPAISALCRCAGVGQPSKRASDRLARLQLVQSLPIVGPMRIRPLHKSIQVLTHLNLESRALLLESQATEQWTRTPVDNAEDPRDGIEPEIPPLMLVRVDADPRKHPPTLILQRQPLEEVLQDGGRLVPIGPVKHRHRHYNRPLEYIPLEGRIIHIEIRLAIKDLQDGADQRAPEYSVGGWDLEAEGLTGAARPACGQQADISTNAR